MTDAREPAAESPNARRAARWLPGILWPRIPVGRGRPHPHILSELDQSQWWPPERIREAQFGQLQPLLAHARDTVPFYRARLDQAGIDPRAPLSEETWRRIPLLTRRDLQSADLASTASPRAHGRILWRQSSGSTGEPVKISATGVTTLFWQVFTLRDHAWHRRDFSGRLASIRAPTETREPRLSPSWGPPVTYFHRTGPGGSLSLNVDVSKQAAWLMDFDPDYLLTYASNLLAILDYCRERGLRPGRLREVRNISETVGDHVRQACREVWDVPIVDIYSAQEVGYIALQCPESGCYHVQEENVLVEVLDDAGRPCAPGQVGRVVVTHLHNFATPLIRYELRDRAEAGAACACGRGLGTLNRILGRERNMLVLPGGEKRWPLTGYRQYGEIAPEVRQFQFVQRSLERIEVRLVVASPLPPATEQALREHIRGVLQHPFEVSFTFMDEIPRSPSGKFEEFISEVT